MKDVIKALRAGMHCEPCGEGKNAAKATRRRRSIPLAVCWITNIGEYYEHTNVPLESLQLP